MMNVARATIMAGALAVLCSAAACAVAGCNHGGRTVSLSRATCFYAPAGAMFKYLTTCNRELAELHSLDMWVYPPGTRVTFDGFYLGNPATGAPIANPDTLDVASQLETVAEVSISGCANKKPTWTSTSVDSAYGASCAAQPDRYAVIPYPWKGVIKGNPTSLPEQEDLLPSRKDLRR